MLPGVVKHPPLLLELSILMTPLTAMTCLLVDHARHQPCVAPRRTRFLFYTRRKCTRCYTGTLLRCTEDVPRRYCRGLGRGGGSLLHDVGVGISAPRMPHGGRGVSVAKDIMLEGKVRCDEKRGDECINQV